ncbi:MAG: rod shape-determining protein RodA [Flavobacteriaceae bacterium]
MNKKVFLFDWISFLLMVTLIIIGLFNIYSTTYDVNSSIFNYNIPVGKQFFFLNICFFFSIIILLINSKSFEKYSSIIYFISIILLIGLLFFGKNVSGATSWYTIGGLSFQPSEFSKLATSLAVAKILSEIQTNIKKPKSLIQLSIIILIPGALIILQPDPGTALIFSAFFFVLFREGLSYYYLLIFSIGIMLFILTLLLDIKIIISIIFIFTSLLYIIARKLNKKTSIYPYLTSLSISIIFVFSSIYLFNNIFEQRHRDRFNIILGKEVDSQGIGYNINQSIIAIGSGGLNGKGFLQGTQTKGDFVPEQHTDFIFSTIGEEWGFSGSLGLILIFSILIIRITMRAEKQKNKFSRIYSYSLASILSVHFFVNIGMSLGLIPSIGIPLPFISYGGSSLLTFTCMMFIYFNLDINRLN